jgi:hypothetical protein
LLEEAPLLLIIIAFELRRAWSAAKLGGKERPPFAKMSMEVGVELEDLEQPSSPLPGDDVPLIQREGEPAPESFENRENKHDGQRTSILTRQTSGKLEGTSQRTVTQESVIKETEEHTKSTFVSVVQRNIDDNPFIEPLPEKQDPDIPTPKDHLTREKQAELRRLDDLEAADRGYTPRMNVEEMVFLSMAILHPSSIYIHHLHPSSSPIIFVHHHSHTYLPTCTTTMRSIIATITPLQFYQIH